MLLNIAKEGNGTFHFIPSSILLGTNFVNCLANIMAAFSQHSVLRIMPAAGVRFTTEIPGGYSVSEESWGRQIFLGPLQCDQERDIVIPVGGISLGDAPYMEITLTYVDNNGTEVTQSIKPTERITKQHAITA